MIDMDDATIDRLVDQFHMGKNTAARVKAAAKMQRDPDFKEAEDYRRRMNSMGASMTIERALEIVKKEKQADGNRS